MKYFTEPVKKLIDDFGADIKRHEHKLLMDAKKEYERNGTLPEWIAKILYAKNSMKAPSAVGIYLFLKLKKKGYSRAFENLYKKCKNDTIDDPKEDVIERINDLVKSYFPQFKNRKKYPAYIQWCISRGEIPYEGFKRDPEFEKDDNFSEISNEANITNENNDNNNENKKKKTVIDKTLHGVYEGYVTRSKLLRDWNPFHLGKIIMLIDENEIKIRTTARRNTETCDRVHYYRSDPHHEFMTVILLMETERGDEELKGEEFPFQFNFIIERKGKEIYLEGSLSGIFSHQWIPINGACILRKINSRDAKEYFKKNEAKFNKQESRKKIDINDIDGVIDLKRNSPWAYNFFRENKYTGAAAFANTPPVNPVVESLAKKQYSMYMLTGEGGIHMRRLPVKFTELGYVFLKGSIVPPDDKNKIKGIRYREYTGRAYFYLDQYIVINVFERHHINGDGKKFAGTEEDCFYCYQLKIKNPGADPVTQWYQGVRAALESFKNEGGQHLTAARIFLFPEKRKNFYQNNKYTEYRLTPYKIGGSKENKFLKKHADSKKDTLVDPEKLRGNETLKKLLEEFSGDANNIIAVTDRSPNTDFKDYKFSTYKDRFLYIACMYFFMMKKAKDTSDNQNGKKFKYFLERAFLHHLKEEDLKKNIKNLKEAINPRGIEGVKDLEGILAHIETDTKLNQKGWLFFNEKGSNGSKKKDINKSKSNVSRINQKKKNFKLKFSRKKGKHKNKK